MGGTGSGFGISNVQLLGSTILHLV